MSAKLIDGKQCSAELRAGLKEEIAQMVRTGETAPQLAVVLVGNDPASEVYVRNKHKACDETGIRSKQISLGADTSEAQLLSVIDELNRDADVDGILVQLPLPAHIDATHILHAIDYRKDVDGFHPMNVGALMTGDEGFVSCTPAGVIELCKRYDIPLSGKHCVIVGRSNIVGKPLAHLMLRENATVTVCHSKTADLEQVCRTGDILVAAVGRAKMIGASYIKPGACVIDVGINRGEDGKLCGDVDYDAALEVASAITPVPGGVGPMTIAMLLKNCYLAKKKRI